MGLHGHHLHCQTNRDLHGTFYTNLIMLMSPQYVCECCVIIVGIHSYCHLNLNLNLRGH